MDKHLAKDIVFKLISPMIVIIGLLIAYINEDDTKNQPMAKIESNTVYPLFPGCIDDDTRKTCFIEQLHQEFKTHLRLPEELTKSNIHVIVGFNVSRQGKLKLHWIKSRTPELRKETVRIFKLLPLMQNKPQSTSMIIVKLEFSS